MIVVLFQLRIHEKKIIIKKDFKILKIKFVMFSFLNKNAHNVFYD